MFVQTVNVQMSNAKERQKNPEMSGGNCKSALAPQDTHPRRDRSALKKRALYTSRWMSESGNRNICLFSSIIKQDFPSLRRQTWPTHSKRKICRPSGEPGRNYFFSFSSFLIFFFARSQPFSTPILWRRRQQSKPKAVWITTGEPQETVHARTPAHPAANTVVMVN